MAASKAVWGIDLGQCALKAIKLQPGEKGVDVVDHVYIEHAKILSQPDVDRNALIEEAMKKFLEQHDLTKEMIVVGVPGQHTLARFSKLPPVEKKKIPDIVRYEAQQQIPFDMDEVIWDYQTFSGGEADTEVGIFAMRRELLRNHLHFVAGFNLEPRGVQSGPLALYNALKYDGLIGSEPVAILDIGTQNADLIVAEGASLWTRNIPIGGNNFTEALSKTFKVSFRKAENLKRDAAKSKYARQIFQAMRPVFADLVAEVQRSIGFFTSSRRGVRLSKLIAMGAAFKLPGLQKFLQQNLGMDVIRPPAFSKLSLAGTPNAAQLTEQLMSYGVAYGLALQGLGLSAITSNLLPPEIAKQVVWRKKIPFFYGAAACLALSALVVWGRTYRDSGVIASANAESSVPRYEITYKPEDKEQLNPQVDPRATQIINGGTVPGGTPVARAKTVTEVANHMDAVLSKVRAMNEPLIAEAKQVSDLQTHKNVWPAVLRMIHAAIPVDARLNDAMKKGPEAYQQFIAANAEAYARPKRKQVFLASFRSEFSPDVMSDFKQRSAARRSGAAAPAPAGPGLQQPADAAAAEPKPGFLVTLVGRTTNADNYEFLKKSFYANLENAKEGKDAYVGGVFPVDCIQVSKLTQEAGGAAAMAGGQSLLVGLGAPVTPAGGLSSTGFGGDARAAAAERVDPVTKEPINTDWVFEIIVAVVLGEKPAPAPAAPGGAPAAP